MASFLVSLKGAAERDLRKLPPEVISRIVASIDSLATEPFPPQSRKLSGAKGLCRLRVGDYRVVYSVDMTERSVLVHYVRHRREAYRSL